MFDRDPISAWVHGNIALLGDAAHPPLQYIAQGAIMAIEDGYVLARHVAASQTAGQALKAYEQVRAEHCRRVLTTSRAWGQLWHLDGAKRLRRNAILRARDTYDYSFTDWIYGPTALTPDQEPALYRPVPLNSIQAEPEPRASGKPLSSTTACAGGP
jgi:salicylate hydroxylase